MCELLAEWSTIIQKKLSVALTIACRTRSYELVRIYVKIDNEWTLSDYINEFSIGDGL